MISLKSASPKFSVALAGETVLWLEELRCGSAVVMDLLIVPIQLRQAGNCGLTDTAAQSCSTVL